APSSVNTYSMPSRPTWMPVRESTPSWTTLSAGAAAGEAARSASHRSRRRELAHVVERLAARQPGDGGVAAPVDGALHELTGHHIDDPQRPFLVATFRQLVGQQPSLVVRLPVI